VAIVDFTHYSKTYACTLVPMGTGGEGGVIVRIYEYPGNFEILFLEYSIGDTCILLTILVLALCIFL